MTVLSHGEGLSAGLEYDVYSQTDSRRPDRLGPHRTVTVSTSFIQSTVHPKHSHTQTCNSVFIVQSPDYIIFCQLVSDEVAVSCVLPHGGRVLSDGPTATMETGVLWLQVLDFGTAFQLICDKLTLALNNLNGY